MYEDGNLITYLQVTCTIMKELEAVIYELIILRSKLDKLCTNLKFIFLFLPSTGVPLRFQLWGYLLYPPVWGLCWPWEAPGRFSLV